MTSPTERSSRGWTNDDEETGAGRQEPSVTSGKQATALLCSRVVFTAGNWFQIHTRPSLDFSPVSHLKYCHSFLNVCPLSPPTHACVPASQVLFCLNRSPWSRSIFCFLFLQVETTPTCAVFASGSFRASLGAVFVVLLSASSCNRAILALLLDRSDCPNPPILNNRCSIEHFPCVNTHTAIKPG